MRIFDAITRDDHGPKPYGEGLFSYYNRSARPEIARIRNLIEEWFERYPDKEKVELRARMHSDDVSHRSALFELVLHELLLRLDCDVEIHPTPIGGVKKKPDFLVHPRGGEDFFMEGVIATGESQEKAAADARTSVVYDVLNKNFDSPNFFVGMKIQGMPATQPSGRRIASFLSQFFSQYDPDELAEVIQRDGLSAAPRKRFDDSGWSIDFFPIPKSSKIRGQAGIRPLGLHMPEVQWVDSKSPIRQAILKKGGRYGKLDLPYVVAVNALDPFVDDIDFTEALFGSEEFTVRLGPEGQTSDPLFSRSRDGAWIDRSGPRYTRVSASLFTVHLSHSSFGNARSFIIQNPWAEKSCPTVLERLTTWKVVNDRLHALRGESLSSILQIPDGWPYH